MPRSRSRLAFCLDTAHLWGAGHDISTADGATRELDRFDALIGLDRLALVHLNDSRSELGSRNDRHEHLGAGKIGPEGLAAFLRDPRLARRTAFMMETPGVDEGYDAVNMRRALLLYGGATTLPELPPKAFKTSRRSTRAGIGRDQRSRPRSGHEEGPGGQYPGLREWATRSGSAAGTRHVVGVIGLARTIAVRLARLAVRALPSAADTDVGLHQLTDVRLGQDLVAAQRVFDARRRQCLPRGLAGEVGRAVPLVVDLAQATRQLGGGAQ